MRLWTRVNESHEVHIKDLVEMFDSEASMLALIEEMYEDGPQDNWKQVQDVSYSPWAWA